MLDTILTIAIVFYVGFQIGTHYMAFKLRHLIIRDAISKGIEVNTLTEFEEQTNLKLVIEYHQNSLYLFNSKDDGFVCQANTIEDLARLAKEYKNIKHAYVLDSKTNTIFTFVDGKVV